MMKSSSQERVRQMMELNKTVLNRFDSEMKYHRMDIVLKALTDSLYLQSMDNLEFKSSPIISNALDNNPILKPNIPISDLAVYYINDIVFIKHAEYKGVEITHYPYFDNGTLTIMSYDHFSRYVDLSNLISIFKNIFFRKYNSDDASLFMDIALIQYLDRMISSGKVTRVDVMRVESNAYFIKQMNKRYNLINFPNIYIK